MKDPFEGSLFTTGTPKDIHHRGTEIQSRLAQGVPGVLPKYLQGEAIKSWLRGGKGS